jgi:hypothetical protein
MQYNFNEKTILTFISKPGAMVASLPDLQVTDMDGVLYAGILKPVKK